MRSIMHVTNIQARILIDFQYLWDYTYLPAELYQRVVFVILVQRVGWFILIERLSTSA